MAQSLTFTENHIAEKNAVIDRRQDCQGNNIFLVVKAGEKVKDAIWQTSQHISRALLQAYKDDEQRLGEIEKQADSAVSFDLGIFERDIRLETAFQRAVRLEVDVQLSPKSRDVSLVGKFGKTSIIGAERNIKRTNTTPHGSMLPTPSTSHVDYVRVYEPAEDSYLLLDNLASSGERIFLEHRFPSASPAPVVLEVGTGSGVVLAFITAHAETIFGRSDIATIGTDVNPFACEATAETVRLATAEQVKASKDAGKFCDCLVGDLSTALRPGVVDILIFNPPYVPTEALPEMQGNEVTGSQDVFERDSRLLALSYAGGINGMETTDRLLDQLPGVLSHRGVAYVLLCKQNFPNAVIERIQKWSGGWNAVNIGSSGKKAGWEQLCILRIWRP
ncbi:S-adenosylmethionine-dependent methyltransferase [Elasticomyces elasticus]|nr:S-adenosylmethionine-dependent methyltransferase [Elasticomyces elasticus]KAK3620219.1 S-adenosylmethionine-dependent methyltransferase [Elasticomyces elasticus]KAK4904405.1 S-adenosylmethionine-dependent methyltransferase [Elasticomyces elasticus]KAK5739619.1 S-adenosylmethionine-dependent methyltransferase [Elasticomyces elasticus]